MGRVFISHAEADIALVKSLVNLLQTGLDISRKQIFCTSLEGMRIKPGTSFIGAIKDELTSSDYVIMIITPAYYESAFCMCELGATWVQGKDAFPLLVPPIGYDNLKAVLHGVQSGKINDERALNDLNDRLTELKIASPAAGRWESERDAFLAGLPAMIAKIPARTLIPAAEFEKLNNTYKATVETVAEQRKQLEEKQQMIEELKKAKDAAEVMQIIKKDMKEIDQFNELTAKVREQTSDLPNCVVEAIFQTQSSDGYPGPATWNNDGDWESIRAAAKREMLIIDSHQIKVDSSHPKIKRANKSIGELREFLAKAGSEFHKAIEDENDFQCSMSNRDFWREFLGLV